MSCFTYLILIPSVFFVIKYIRKLWQENKMSRMLDRQSMTRVKNVLTVRLTSGDYFAKNRWTETPKDIVILHMINRGKTCPSISNYVLKIETYLRMCGIKYQVDITDPWGPKGRFPWITLNGQHVADSELIIEFLSKKFEKNLSKNVDVKTLAIATSCRLMLEEHAFWGFVLERYVFNPDKYVSNFINFPKYTFLGKRYLYKTHKARGEAQGLGLHSEAEIIQLVSKDLRALSIILGENKFICGETPTEQDCGIFAFLAEIVWTLPDSHYEQLVKGELKNLHEYCFRMREKFYPDWNQLLQN